MAPMTEDAQPVYIDIETIPGMVEALRASFNAGKTRSISWRKQQLLAVAEMIEQHEAEIQEALHADLGKPRLEGFTSEIGYCIAEAREAAKHLGGWAKPKKVSTPLHSQPGSSWIYKDPLGVALIIAPWNYPFSLAIAPLLGAIAAGNCAIVKPSEVASHTSALLEKLLPKFLDNDCIGVATGGIPETTALLGERFDHIFYTGNGMVGRIVMAAAAKHLTPVTLELGGKSPCIVDHAVNLDVTCKRICWGKFFNAGQTCVAPDYILVHERIHDEFVAKMKETLQEFYGSDPKQSQDFARIVNARHHDRLTKLLGSGETAVGGEHDRDELYIAPTLLTGVADDDPVMLEEIFGPILPIQTFSSVDDVVRTVNGRDKPLALYVFTTNSNFHETILTRTSSGGASINHAWMHLGNPNLPFGGVGESGMGAYHGQASFDTFCHQKSVLKKSFKFDVDLVYPPYTEKKIKMIKRLL